MTSVKPMLSVSPVTQQLALPLRIGPDSMDQGGLRAWVSRAKG